MWVFGGSISNLRVPDLGELHHNHLPRVVPLVGCWV
jgi:hypothetical protein